MHDLSIRKVPGVGRVNERLLEALGIKTCGDIFKHRATLQLMDKQFGLVFLLRTYLGIASNVVQPYQREEKKSIGAERTFRALSNKTQILAKLEEVAGELEDDMVRGGWTGKTVTLKFKLDTFQVFTRAKSFDRWVSSKKEDLFAIGKELLLPELPLTLRLIGLRITKLKDLHAPEPAGGINSLNLQVRRQERDRDLLAMQKIATTKTTLEKIMNRCRGSMKKKKIQMGKVSMLPMMMSRLISLTI
jgi:DNA polymerase kappa